MIKAAVLLCIYADISPRKAVKALEVMNMMLHGLLGDLPAHTTIRTWLAKMGLDAIRNRTMGLGQAYALIVDCSISVNRQTMLLATKVPADHPGHALTHADEEIVGMSVSDSWPAEKVGEFLEEVIAEQGAAPQYVLSDNGSNLRKAAALIGVPHHCDISHTFAMYLKQLYEKDEDFVAFRKAVGDTKHLVLSQLAYLMPPKQRFMARYMNMYAVVDWAERMLDNFHRLTPNEKFHYSFVQRHASIAEELCEVLATFSFVMKIIKNEGLSAGAVGKCRECMDRNLLAGSGRERRLRDMMTGYLDKESRLLSAAHPAHNISSDLIESDFGMFKQAMPANKTNGFTESILYIPLRPKLRKADSLSQGEVKAIMERNTVGDVADWKKLNLKSNPLVKRRNLLARA